MINSQELKVIVLDNGAFHKAKRLKVPKNIILIFLPPFSPELNPAEKMWAKFKRAFTNKLYKSLEDVSLFIQSQTQNLKNDETKNTCAFDYIFLNHFWNLTQRQIHLNQSGIFINGRSFNLVEMTISSPTKSTTVNPENFDTHFKKQNGSIVWVGS